jgi:hypothetical protein
LIEPLRALRSRAAPAQSVSQPAATPAEALAEQRGRFFTDLDRLAFALELEGTEALGRGDEDEARRIEDRRLGVRLAQRLIAGVHADEVDLRIERTRADYDARTYWKED